MERQAIKNLVFAALAEAPYPDPRFPPSPYYRFLRQLAATMQPRLSVELGVCGGGGSFHLLLGWPLSPVVGIDKDVEYPLNMTFIRERYPNFDLRRGDSVELAPEIYGEYGQVDILFIDTIHTYERTLAEFNAWQPYLSRRAIVCLDDLNRVEMGTIFEDLPGTKMRLNALHPGAEMGFGILYDLPRG